MTDERPRVAARFDPLEEAQIPLFVAIGRAVVGVEGLEKMLLLEAARLHSERDPNTIAEQIGKLEARTGGQLLAELRKLGIPPDLAERIWNVIARRNELVHNLSWDPEFIMAAADGTGLEPVVTRIEQIALDAGALAVELHTIAVPKLEVKWGSRESIAAQIKAIDLEQVKNPRARRQIEAVQALGDSDLDLRDLFDPPPDS